MLEHCIQRRLLFHEADPAGIAQFHIMFAWAQEAEQSLFRRLRVPLREYWAASGKKQIGWARQHASLDFFRPIVVDEKFTVRLKLTKMTQRTLTFDVLIENTTEVKAKGVIRTVCVQGHEGHFRSTQIPEVVRNKIRSHHDKGVCATRAYRRDALDT
jgi:acyl-CoA thioesterase FadM